MSPTQTRIPLSDTPAGRRRHARHTESHWVRKAGVAGGVIGTAILTSAAAPPASAHGPAGVSSPLDEVTRTLDLSQLRAADATAQAVVNYQLQAAQDEAAADAAKAARKHKESERRKAAAEAKAKAAEARAAAARRAATADTVTLAASSTPSSASSSASGSIQTVLDFVRSQVGKPYVMGATGPGAFDCSGLVQAAFRTIGVELPRVSQSQSTAGTQVSLSNLQPGDILYWGGAGSAYHVAVYVGGGNFIGAQNPSSGVVEHPLSYDEPTGAVRVA